MFRFILVPLTAGFLAGAVWGINLDLNRPIVTDDPRDFIASKVKAYMVETRIGGKIRKGEAGARILPPGGHRG